MDAETYVKTVKRICNPDSCYGCLLYDSPEFDCVSNTDYKGTINPIPIVEQWLKDHPEPKPLPLPPKLRVGCTYGDMINAINQLIDHLK